MGSCFRRKIKVEPEPEEDETDWVDGAERQNADLDKERRGEFLDKKDVEAVHKAFGEAAARFGSGSGGETLSASKLAEGHGESRGNPLAKRIFASFSEKQDGTLGKEDWVAACCVLSSGGSKANKARTAFQSAYDLDGDGFVNVDDLRGTLSSILGDALSSQQVEQIVARLMGAFDADDDHRLTEEEFRNLLSEEDYDARFTMDLY